MTVAEHSSVGLPVTHEILERPASAGQDFLHWSISQNCADTLNWISSNFKAFQLQEKTDRSIAFLNSDSKKGFVIYLQDSPRFARFPEFLMDFLRDRALACNYKLYTSDTKTFSSGEFVETQQRHYLKPPIDFIPDQKLSQLFGNISIEFVLRNDQPYLFKFSATTYRDHLFQDAESFDQLLTQVLYIN